MSCKLFLLVFIIGLVESESDCVHSKTLDHLDWALVRGEQYVDWCDRTLLGVWNRYCSMESFLIFCNAIFYIWIIHPNWCALLTLLTIKYSSSSSIFLTFLWVKGGSRISSLTLTKRITLVKNLMARTRTIPLFFCFWRHSHYFHVCTVDYKWILLTVLVPSDY